MYKDSLHLVDQGNVKLVKLIVSTLTAQNNHINFVFKIRNTLQSVPATISFSFEDDDCPPLTMFVDLSLNLETLVTMSLLEASSNVSGIVERLYQCKPVIVVCSSNVSKQNVCNVSGVSKLVKPLSVSKPVCSTIVSKL